MIDTEIQQKFIQRRAQGWPFARMASELGVSKKTLIEWSRKFRFEIQNLRAATELVGRATPCAPFIIQIGHELFAKIRRATDCPPYPQRIGRARHSVRAAMNLRR